MLPSGNFYPRNFYLPQKYAIFREVAREKKNKDRFVYRRNLSLPSCNPHGALRGDARMKCTHLKSDSDTVRSKIGISGILKDQHVSFIV